MAGTLSLRKSFTPFIKSSFCAFWEYRHARQGRKKAGDEVTEFKFAKLCMTLAIKVKLRCTGAVGSPVIQISQIKEIETPGFSYLDKDRIGGGVGLQVR